MALSVNPTNGVVFGRVPRKRVAASPAFFRYRVKEVGIVRTLRVATPYVNAILRFGVLPNSYLVIALHRITDFCRNGFAHFGVVWNFYNFAVSRLWDRPVMFAVTRAPLLRVDKSYIDVNEGIVPRRNCGNAQKWFISARRPKRGLETSV